MGKEKTIREDILTLAQHAKHYTKLLIRQCDSWLTEEEGRKNVEERLKKKKKKE